MDFIDRFTEGARRALALSQDSAKEMGHNYVGSEHLLLGLIKEGEGAAALAARLEDSGTPGEFVLRRDPATVDGDPRRLALSESELDSGAERILLVHDVTDTHRMRLTAERNERLAAMGEMVAGLAHQLRTPLAAALLYTGNLRT